MILIVQWPETFLQIPGFQQIKRLIPHLEELNAVKTMLFFMNINIHQQINESLNTSLKTNISPEN